MGTIRIYTVGICKAMSGKDAIYAAILTYGDKKKYVSGLAKHSTQNQVEVIAALEAMKILKASGKSKAIEIYSLSNYLVRGFNESIQTWKCNGWCTSKKKTIKNKAQWKAIEQWKEYFPQTVAIKSDFSNELIMETYNLAKAQRRESILNGANV